MDTLRLDGELGGQWLTGEVNQYLRLAKGRHNPVYKKHICFAQKSFKRNIFFKKKAFAVLSDGRATRKVVMGCHFGNGTQYDQECRLGWIMEKQMTFSHFPHKNTILKLIVCFLASTAS